MNAVTKELTEPDQVILLGQGTDGMARSDAKAFAPGDAEPFELALSVSGSSEMDEERHKFEKRNLIGGIGSEQRFALDDCF